MGGSGPLRMVEADDSGEEGMNGGDAALQEVRGIKSKHSGGLP